MGKWSAASEIYVEDVFMSFSKYCREVVNMSYYCRLEYFAKG